jgi:hypothetical protein
LTPKDVNTFFIIPDQYTNKNELQYYEANGDTHTLHPHVGTVWDTSQSVTKYQTAITNNKAIINNLANVTDYGFSSWRFPMTTFCTNSMKAVSNSGFVIDSSNGMCTCGIQIGTPEDNTVLFPKQMIISSQKSNLIEMEIPTLFDIDCANGIDFYNQYNAYMPCLQNGNFPMNFVVGGHIQGIGTNTSLTNGLAQIIDASKNTGTSYTNFNTLANYLTATKNAKITASTSGKVTTITVVNAKPITDFTIKVAIGNVASATCNGGAVSGTKQDGTNWYVTQTIPAGTNTFAITTA